jgi:hypothetical protein
LKTKYISEKRLHKPWLSAGILKSIREKSKYFKLAKLGIISADFNRAYKNKLNIIIRAAKMKFYRESFENSCSDIKKTWLTIKKTYW